MDQNESRERLIEQAVTGDNGATAQLLVSHSSRLARRFENRLRLNAYADFSADDVLQEVFVDVFKGIGTFCSGEGVPFAAWLDRVADNRLAKFFRDRSRIKRGGRTWRVDAAGSSVIRLMNDLCDEGAKTASEQLAANEAKQALELCVAALPDQQREAVEKCYLEEQGLEDIAESMEITKDAVRGLLYRAKNTMRQMMGESSRWFRKK